ncbi:tetratricopeptide repeat protein [Syntrophus gentianae]|nr:tetratricopeptide repeat protein [Syntrophus gentianae]
MTLPYGVRNKSIRFLIIFFCLSGVALWGHAVCRAEANDQNRRIKQVSSYQKAESAIQDVNRLKSKGLEAYYKEVEIPGKGTWYRVFTAESQPQVRSRTPVKEKKSPQTNVKPAPNPSSSPAKGIVSPPQKPNPDRPATNPPNSRVKEAVPPFQKTDPGKEGERMLKDTISGKSQGAFSKNVLPGEKGGKSEPTADSKGDNGSVQVPAKGSPVSFEYESAKAAFDARRYEQAAGILSSLLIRKQNDAAQYESSLRLLADCYYFLGQGESNNFRTQAVESYKNILRYYPDVRNGNDAANFRLADSLEQMGSYEEAYEAYENVLSKYPNSPYRQEAIYRVGKILYLTKRFNYAVDKLKSYLTSYPDGPSAFQASFLLGYCLRQINQKPDGDAWYRNALTKWNNFEELPTEILHDLGLYLFSQQDYPRAANIFNLCFNLHPDDAWRKSALFNLGRSYYFWNRFSPALKVFSLLLESYPGTLEANESILFMANIGVIDPKTDFNACMTGRDYFKNPIETYDWMRARFPGGSLEEWLLYQKGYALWKAGRSKEALDLYCLLLDSFPHGRLQQASRGYLVLNAKRLIEESYGKGDFLAVADLYYKIRNKVPLSSEATGMFFKIGDCLWKLGLRADAVALLDRLKSNGNEAQRAISDLVMMESTYSQGEMTEEKWKALLAELAKNNGETANMARRNLANYLYGKGQYDKVIPLYEAMLKGEGRSDLLPISRNYAHALRNNRMCSAAINRYQEIINKCKENPQKCDSAFIADAYAGLGDCYYEAADYERNLAMYQQALPGIKDKESSMWTLFRMGQSYRKMNDSAMAGKTFAQIKEKSGDAFWPKVVDYWVADEAWSKNNSEYLKKN